MKSFRRKYGSDDERSGPGSNAERDFRGEKRSNETHASATDPDARLYRKSSGASAASATGLSRAFGVPKNRKVYGIDVQLAPPQGRTRKPVPSEEPRAAEDVLAERAWWHTTWRHGTKSKLAAQFAAVRVRVADGRVYGNNHHLPGQETWLVG